MAAAALLGYVLGSIPFGLIITRLGGQGDIRNIGSGNIGTTNVLRTGKKSLTALTLLCDTLKATLSVLIIAEWAPLGASNPLAIYLPLIAGGFAFLGHLYPIWLKFNGGKGVATYLGVLFAVYWPMALGFIALWISTALITRFSSLSALLTSLLTPFILWVFNQYETAGLMALMTLILWMKHHENIARLMNGTESKIGNKG
nr:glycerol-3-phosphate 1-O-acyltransferase PlsY [Pseudovibrio hongkongensis]